MGEHNYEVNFIGMGNLMRPPEMEDGEYPTYPERRLWSAVILATIHEYEEWLLRIESTWNNRQQPVNLSYFQALRIIRHECGNDWFAHICEMAEIAPDLILTKFDRLDREYCVRSIPRTDSPVTAATRWEIRKANARKLIRRG